MPYKDKKKQKKAQHLHYLKNKKDYQWREKKAIKRNKKFVLEYLYQHPCVDCGESDPVVLEFDHIKGEKFKELNYMTRNSYSIETIKKEIEKCEVRCANCHRRITAKRQNWVKRQMAEE